MDFSFTPVDLAVLADFDDTCTNGLTSQAYYGKNFEFDGKPFEEGKEIGRIQDLLIAAGLSRGESLGAVIRIVNQWFKEGRGKYVGSGVPQQVPFTLRSLQEMALEVPYAPGVIDFPTRLKAYARRFQRPDGNPLTLGFYILSSNATDFLKATELGKRVDGIFASNMEFNPETGEIIGVGDDWMSPERKAEVAPRIKKQYGLSLKQMAMIGDGDTDRPVLRYVKNGGGRAVGVCTQNCPNPYLTKMIEEDEINVASFNDFRAGSPLEQIFRDWIDSVAYSLGAKAEHSLIPLKPELRIASIPASSVLVEI